MCYIPVRITTNWTVTVGAPAGPKQHQDVFGRIAFGTGEAPTLAGSEAPQWSRSFRPRAPRQATATTSRRSRTSTRRATTFGYLSSSDFLTFIHNAENGVREKGLFEGRGPIAILLIVLLGGLALNLTPCVLPMIPINLAIIGAGAQAGSRGRGFLLGGAYGAAMALVYGVLGLIVILTASTFGTINSYSWFNPGIAAAVRRPRAGDVRRHRHRLLALLEQRPVSASRAAAPSSWRSAWAPSRRCSPAPASRRS